MPLGSYNWKVMFNWLLSKQLRKEQDQIEKKDFGLESRIQITDKFKAIRNSMFR